MVVEIMGKPLEKMKRIRSLDEILTRGGQALTAYRDQMFGGADVPSDEEFVRLIDAEQFGKAPIIAESLWQKFYKNGDKRFFAPLREAEARRKHSENCLGMTRPSILSERQRKLSMARSICSDIKASILESMSIGIASRFREKGFSVKTLEGD